jgi:ribonuclease III
MSEAAVMGEAQSVALLRSLLDELPDELARQVFTHASWTERRSESYARLAFLGDSVLSLAITTHLYPRLEAERFGAGRLTKIRAQAVSGRSCRAVAERLGVGERLRAAAPENGEGRHVGMLETERVLASVLEAVIGACYLNAGYETTAEAVVEAFVPEIEHALENPLDFKSALQELLARRGETIAYQVTDEHGPPHDRTFEVVALLEGKPLGAGRGRSKKHAEQQAAAVALEGLSEA